MTFNDPIRALLNEWHELAPEELPIIPKKEDECWHIACGDNLGARDEAPSGGWVEVFCWTRDGYWEAEELAMIQGALIYFLGLHKIPLTLITIPNDENGKVLIRAKYGVYYKDGYSSNEMTLQGTAMEQLKATTELMLRSYMDILRSRRDDS